MKIFYGEMNNGASVNAPEEEYSGIGSTLSRYTNFFG